MAEREYAQIQLDDTYRISSDRLNWILEKYEDVMDIKSKLPTGEKKWKIVGYFGANFSMALKRHVIDSVNEVGKTGVNEVLDKLNKISKQIDDVVKRENIQLAVKDND